MDLVRDLFLASCLLFIQWTGAAADLLGVLPIPRTPQQWGEAFAWCILFLFARVADRARRRRAARRKRAKTALSDENAPPLH